jgi:hypothetical protein
MATLTDEEMDKLAAEAGPQVPTGRPLTDAEMDQFGAAPQAESRAQEMMLNGLTFGLRPRIKAAWESGAVSGPEYEAAKQSEWAKDDAYRAQSPWAATALEIGGSLPTMFAPGFGAGRLAQAANQGVNTVQNLSRGARLARAAGVGRNVGSVGHEAGVLGAKTATAFGAGSSREDTIGGRIGEGISHAPFGYAFGRGGDALMRPIAGVGEYLYDAARVGGNAELGALTSMQRAMRRDNITPQAIRDAVLPDMGRMNAPQQAVESAVTAYGTSMGNGATEAASRRAARQAYVTQARAAGSQASARTLNQQANRALDQYAAQMEIPLALDETARLAGASGQNMQWTRRTAASAPGEGKERLFSNVTGRQESIIPTVRARVEDTMGDADWLAAKDRLTQANRAIEDRVYGSARANEQPFDLTPVLDAFNRTQAFAGGKVRAATEEALRIMRGTPDMATGQYPRHTIDTYIQSRGQLNDLVEESMRVNPVTGRQSPTSATRQLMDLKEQMDAIVGASNPSWRSANNLTRDLRSVERAMDDGMRVKLKGNDNVSSRIINQVEQMRTRISTLERAGRRTSAQDAELDLLRNRLEAYQAGFARTLHKELDSMGDTHTVSKAFLKGGRGARSGPRRTLEVMMGRDEAAAFMQQMRRADIAGTTYKNQFNSQTTPLKEAIDNEKETSRIAGMFRMLGYIGRPSQMLSDAGEALGNRLYSERAGEIARRLEATTDNPQDFFALLRELETLALGRGRAFTAERLNAYSAPGIASSGTGAVMQSRQAEDEKERMRRLGGY